MYLSRLILNPRNRLVRSDLGDCQSLHRTIMSAFPSIPGHGSTVARSKHAILYRLEGNQFDGLPVLYVQSRTQPDWSALEPGYLADVPSSGNPVCKPVSAQYGAIKRGMVLAFRLRANPTRKVDTKSGPEGERRNGRRVPLMGEESLREWLERKAAAGGFSVLAVDMQDEGAHSVLHGIHPAGKLSLRAVCYTGRLIVTEPERFRAALEAGIGPGKAYGCGLLSVAPDVQ